MKSSLFTTISVAVAEISGMGDQFPLLSRHDSCIYLSGAQDGLPLQLIEVLKQTSSRDLIVTSSPWSGAVKHNLGQS